MPLLSSLHLLAVVVAEQVQQPVRERPAPLVHAVLHLVGYDHGAEMEARERSHA